MENEKPNAVTLEVLNKKIDVLIEDQLAINKKIDKNFKVIMKRMNRLQDYNEIADMRAIVTNRELKNIKQIINNKDTYLM